MGIPEKGTMFRSGSFSHTEGYGTTADGFASHAEGYSTIAGESDSVGVAAHAEGIQTSAVSNASHAEGWLTSVSNDAHSGHAEGIQTVVTNRAAHAEGLGTTASGDGSHAEGAYDESDLTLITKALARGSHAEGIGTIAGVDNATGQGSHAEGYSTTASELAAHAEGGLSTASGVYSHAEGNTTTASEFASHAEGVFTRASGITSHAEGINTDGSGDGSHAEGGSTTASGSYSHTEGMYTTAGATASHAEGYQSTASGDGAHAEGVGTTASAEGAHAEGQNTMASGAVSHAEGTNTDTANFIGAHIMGQYGQATNAYSWFLANGTGPENMGLGAKIIAAPEGGPGLTNGFIDGAWNGGGADYAELFETVDGKPIEPGYFVTLNGKKIRIAKADDNYILGVTSANYSVLANSGELRWKGKYLTDDWGRVKMQEVVVPAEIGKDGKVFCPERKEIQPILNPAWDNTKEYISRLRRPEWVAVGLIGQLVVRDDGTCQVDGYCTATSAGIATAASRGYRVLERTGDRQVLILLR